MDQVLLELQTEEAVSLLAPGLQRLKNVETALRVTSKDLDRLTLLRVEAGQPYSRLLAWARRGQLLHSLKNDEPRVKQ